MDAIELHRLSETIIINLSLDSIYGVSSAIDGDNCVWTCNAGTLSTVADLAAEYSYVVDDPNFILQEA